MGKNQWVVKRDNECAVRGEGNSRNTSHHKTQSKATDAAKSIAQNQKSELITQGRDRKFREKNSYGNDDIPSKR